MDDALLSSPKPELLPCPFCGSGRIANVGLEYASCSDCSGQANLEDWNTREARDKRVREDALREAMPVAGALAAAISLLDRSRQQAPSDKMFEQMVADYERALGDFRVLIDWTAEDT